MTEHVSDGQITFYTWLDLTIRTNVKHLIVKIDPSASVNTIPLSRYWNIFPQKIAEKNAPTLLHSTLPATPGSPMMAVHSPS